MMCVRTSIHVLYAVLNVKLQWKWTLNDHILTPKYMVFCTYHLPFALSKSLTKFILYKILLVAWVKELPSKGWCFLKEEGKKKIWLMLLSCQGNTMPHVQKRYFKMSCYFAINIWVIVLVDTIFAQKDVAPSNDMICFYFICMLIVFILHNK